MSIDKINNSGKDVAFTHNTPRENVNQVNHKEKFRFPPINDVNDISEDLRHYFEEGINVKKSSSTFGKNELSFNIYFNTRSQENLTLSGKYNFSSSKLSTNINFSFHKEVNENGETKNKLFQFSYNLEAENISERKTTTKEEKEDILSFIRRISHKVYKLAEDDSLKLRSIFFEEEDLKDIIYFQDEKGRQILMELVNLIILNARMKESENRKKDGIEVDYHPERKKTKIEESSSLKINKFNSTLDIKELEIEKDNEDDNTASAEE